MKIFQSIQDNFALLGINSCQSSQKHPFNVNILATVIWCVFSTASYVLWFIYEADSFGDYMNSALYTFESLICIAGLSALIWKIDQWFQFIEILEITINKSELSIYIQAYQFT